MEATHVATRAMTFIAAKDAELSSGLPGLGLGRPTV